MEKVKVMLNLLMEELGPAERLTVVMTALDYTLSEMNLTIEDVVKLRESVIKEIGEVEAWED